MLKKRLKFILYDELFEKLNGCYLSALVSIRRKQKTVPDNDEYYFSRISYWIQL